MASMTMTASFLAGAAQPVSAPRRGLVVAKAARVTSEADKAAVELNNVAKAEVVNGRRELVFAAATAAVAAIAGVAIADEDEPKPGTPEAKKKYAPVCVTMPTAKICRK